MTLEQWEQDVPDAIKGDLLWKVQAYRLALFAYDLAFLDCDVLRRDERTHCLISQVVRAAGSISANITEGYSRNTGRDRSRFYGYAEGSARELRDWYFKCRLVLKPEVIAHRLELTTSLVKLLIRMSANERRKPDLSSQAAGTRHQLGSRQQATSLTTQERP